MFVHVGGGHIVLLVMGHTPGLNEAWAGVSDPASYAWLPVPQNTLPPCDLSVTLQASRPCLWEEDGQQPWGYPTLCKDSWNVGAARTPVAK